MSWDSTQLRLRNWLVPTGRGAIEGGVAGSIALLVGLATVQLLESTIQVGSLSAETLAVLYVVEGAIFGIVMATLLDVRSVGIATTIVGLLMSASIGAVMVAAWTGYLLFFPILGMSLLFVFVAILVVLVLPATSEDRLALGIWIVVGWTASMFVPAMLAVLAPVLPPVFDPIIEDLAANSVEEALSGGFFYVLFYPFYAPYFVPVLGTFYGAGLRSVRLLERSEREYLRIDFDT